MKRALATLTIAAGAIAVSAPAAQAAQASAPLAGSCMYVTTRDTKLYENKQWDLNRGFFKRVLKGTSVAGPCQRDGDWVRITRIYAFNKWHNVASFQGDQDFMRMGHLRRA